MDVLPVRGACPPLVWAPPKKLNLTNSGRPLQLLLALRFIKNNFNFINEAARRVHVCTCTWISKGSLICARNSKAGLHYPMCVCLVRKEKRRNTTSPPSTRDMARPVPPASMRPVRHPERASKHYTEFLHQYTMSSLLHTERAKASRWWLLNTTSTYTNGRRKGG